MARAGPSASTVLAVARVIPRIDTVGVLHSSEVVGSDNRMGRFSFTILAVHR